MNSDLRISEAYPERGSLPSGLKTDEDGRLTFEVTLPELPDTTLLYESELIARLVEAGGRYVERDLKLPVALDGPRIGVKPAFDGGVDEGGPADFFPSSSLVPTAQNRMPSA
ncbi:hypothetical protein QW131_04910 [Roseibium salinum]|nr:hypothetical protein [Roseibium salinum]